MSLGSLDTQPFRWSEPADSGLRRNFVARFPKSLRGLKFRGEVVGYLGERYDASGQYGVPSLQIAWAVTPTDTRRQYGHRAWDDAAKAAKTHAPRILATVEAILRDWAARTGAKVLVYYPDDAKRDRIYRRMLRRAAPGVTFKSHRSYGGKPEVLVYLP